MPQVLIFAAFVVGTALLFPRGKTYQFANLRVGDVYVGEEIIAPFTFPVSKTEEEYRQDVERARQAVPAVFAKQDSIRDLELSRFSRLLRRLILSAKVSSAAEAQSADLAPILRDYGILLPEESLESLPVLLRQVANSSALVDILSDLYDTGILNLSKSQLSTGSGRLLILDDGREVVDEVRFYYDLEEAKASLLERLRQTHESDDLVKVAYQLSLPFLRPNLIYQEAETQRRVEEAVRSVPRVKGMVLERERIIDSHERVTPEHLQKLRSMAEALAERQAGAGRLRALVPSFGNILYVAAAMGLLLAYLALAQRHVLLARDKSLLVVIILLFPVGVSYFLISARLPAYLVPAAVSSMLLTIFFGSQTGFVGTVTLSLILGGMWGSDFSLAALLLFTGSVAVAAVSRVRTRSWVLNSVARLVAAYVVAVAALELTHFVSSHKLLVSWAQGIAAGFLAPVLTYGLVVVLEYAFDVTTDMTLLELSDLNHPLLRELAFRAPGTYHHSLMVGNLAEAAAEAIGANSLLARVGAYYHDIGKLDMPEYFIENQGTGKNPHDKLSPTMSALILANHIRQGIEKAREAGLPKEVIAFIPEHQGTQLMSYFYERARRSGEGRVDEQKFRYPGPKPQTKETAIVMLADAVEAAVRSLKQPTLSRVRQTVNSIIQRRFNEGELDESPLTLRDLNKIADAFVQILTGLFHPRIEYPQVLEQRAPATGEPVGTRDAAQAPARQEESILEGPGIQHQSAPHSTRPRSARRT
ncbi:MAG: HDIG domain-containing protein [candidate division KSB1 bacterium]|nr:HDIG domain-containing protein [candidate division KSB1 bacterium]